MKMAAMTLEPGQETSWRLAMIGREPIGGKAGPLDVGYVLDEAIRTAHRAGFRIRAAVAKCAGDDLDSRTAVRSIIRVLATYEAVRVEWGSREDREAYERLIARWKR